MAKADVALVTGIAGFLLGAAAVYVAMSLKPTVETLHHDQRNDEDSLGALGEKVEDLKKSVADVNTRLNGLSRDPKIAWDRIDALDAKVRQLAEAVEAAKKQDK